MNATPQPNYVPIVSPAPYRAEDFKKIQVKCFNIRLYLLIYSLITARTLAIQELLGPVYDYQVRILSHPIPIYNIPADASTIYRQLSPPTLSHFAPAVPYSHGPLNRHPIISALPLSLEGHLIIQV